MNSNIDQLVEKIWNFHLMHHQLEKADVIIGLGSLDLRVADKVAELYKENFAPLVLLTGGFGQRSKDLFNEPEAIKLASIVQELGVPSEKILVEDKATNTGENVLFSRDLLLSKKIAPSRIIVVTKPYMERRAYATFKKRWSEIEPIITSPNIPFSKYPNKEQPKEWVIKAVMGDLKRIKDYPIKGYQIPQEIPDDVWDAYLQLEKLGYEPR